MNLLIIGAGKMATALCGGIVKSCPIHFDSITACDPVPAAREHFQAATGLPCVEQASPELVDAADLIILAVKPQVAAQACDALPPRRPQTIIFSICAGISIGKLRGWLGANRIIRVMPNTPLLVGMGASCFALSAGDDCRMREIATAILGSAGKVWEVTEDKLDAVTALSGSGPAYFFAFIEALAAGGEKLGLAPELGEALALQTMLGAGKMLADKCGTPAQLREAVTSRGGTTAAALEVMAKADFNGMVARLMQAASDRSRELGK